MARLGVCEQRTRSRHHIEREQFGGEGGGRQSERSRSKTILGKLRVAMWLWTERCSTQILNYSLDLRRYHHAACSRRITCGMRRMTHTHATSDTQAVGPPPKPKKKSIFLRAVGVGGKRATIELERSAPNARVRAMSASAATDVSWIRARGRAGGRSGRTSAFACMSGSAYNTIPDSRWSEREAKLAVRREPRARERGLRRATLTVGGDAV